VSLTPAKVGRKFFGKTTVAIPQAQKEAWDNQAAEKTWADDGEVGRTLEAIRPTIEKIVSQNATIGASEYLAAAEVAMRASSKDILIGVRLSNAEAVLIGEVSLRQLMMSAIQQAREVAAADPGAQELITTLVQIGRELSGIPAGHNGPQQQPQPMNLSEPRQRIARSTQ
jgi:hypothetical protein